MWGVPQCWYFGRSTACVLSPGVTSKRPPENPCLKHVWGTRRFPGGVEAACPSGVWVCGRETGAQGSCSFAGRPGLGWGGGLVRGPKLLGAPGTEQFGVWAGFFGR